MYAYRLSQTQDQTWHQRGTAQAELEQAIAEILRTLTSLGVLVVSHQGFPLFYVEGGAA
jgi:hypothetical protein